MIELPADMVASFDQGYAESVDLLTNLVGSYVQRRNEDIAEGIPEPVTVMGLVDALSQEWHTEAQVSALAVAVVMIAGHVNDA